MDEVQRVRRVARRDIISLPTFLADVDKYRKQLRQIAVINGLDPRSNQSPAKSPACDVKLAVPKPPRDRQRITTKLTVTRTTQRHSTSAKRSHQTVPALLPAVTGEEADTEKVEKICSKDKLQEACLQLMSTAKRQSRMQKQSQQSASVHGISLAFKRLNFKTPKNLFSLPT